MPQIGVIQEQGDLGLGFNPVDPEQQALLEQVRKEKEDDKKDDK